MTTITIEKELLDRALESMCWAARILNIDPDEAPNYHWSLENIRAALAAPATAPDELERLRAESEERLQNCAALVAENERLRKDAERYRWLRDVPNLYRDHPEIYRAIVEGFTSKEIEDSIDEAMKGTP